MVTKATPSNVLHYHGVYISKHKTVLKYWVKGWKHRESSDKVWDNQQVQNWFKKYLQKSVTLSLQEIIYHDFFFFHASLTYR